MNAPHALGQASLRVPCEPSRPENSRLAVLTLTLTALLFGACEAAPLPSPTPAAASARAQVERIWIDDPNYYVQLPNEMVVDGDREIVVGVDFSQAPRHDEIEPALRAGAPSGSVVEWPTDRRVSVRVPAGGPFDVDLSAAEPAPQSKSLPTSLRFHIDRPTYEVALYRPSGPPDPSPFR